MTADSACKRVADPIHGEIQLSALEQRVIDTASFQRLRRLKQLGMVHLTFPGATHTRFSHSLGVLAIMQRILTVAEDKGIRIDPEDQENLRLAGLLHDIGHYPYSHLMEGIDHVQLTEQIVDNAQPSKTLHLGDPYPDHEELGAVIVSTQPDLIDAIGSQDRAAKVADLFSRSDAADPQFSKLIHSSLDMDRLDYLLRDARACGVPYGQIDLSYLLNCFDVSPQKMVGVSEKALPAAEHFLLARYFMHRRVYWHKTTVGFEEACRQLLRRIRGVQDYDIPNDGGAIKELASGEHLAEFTDSLVDRLIQRAATSDDQVVKALARAIVSRRPPRLLKDVSVRYEHGDEPSALVAFRINCRNRLSDLASRSDLPLGLFMFAESKPLGFEKRGRVMTAAEVQTQPTEKADDLIRIFQKGVAEPKPIVDIPHSLLADLSKSKFRVARLYFVPRGDADDSLVSSLRQDVDGWDVG